METLPLPLPAAKVAAATGGLGGSIVSFGPVLAVAPNSSPRRFLPQKQRPCFFPPLMCSSSSSAAFSGDLDEAGEVVATADHAEDSAVSTEIVRVRFVLQKECTFGYGFVLVGDNPVLGLWDPLKGIPLEWSDGHMWAADLDMVAKCSVRYKFVLRGPSSSDISWQPGPDRVLEVPDCFGSILVLEDWDNPDRQTVTSLVVEEAINVGDSALSEDEDAMHASKGAASELISSEEDMMLVPGLSKFAIPTTTEGKVAMESDLLLATYADASVLQHDFASNSLDGIVEETPANLAREDGQDVEAIMLVPGMSKFAILTIPETEVAMEYDSSPATEVDALILRHDFASNTPVSIVENKDPSAGEEAPVANLAVEGPQDGGLTGEFASSVDAQGNSDGKPESSGEIAHNDILWCRKRLEKFLSGLGFNRSSHKSAG